MTGKDSNLRIGPDRLENGNALALGEPVGLQTAKHEVRESPGTEFRTASGAGTVMRRLPRRVCEDRTRKHRVEETEISWSTRLAFLPCGR